MPANPPLSRQLIENVSLSNSSLIWGIKKVLVLDQVSKENLEQCIRFFFDKNWQINNVVCAGEANEVVSTEHMLV